VTLLRAKPDGSPRNVWQGCIDEIDPEGAVARVRVASTPQVPARIRESGVGRMTARSTG